MIFFKLTGMGLRLFLINNYYSHPLVCLAVWKCLVPQRKIPENVQKESFKQYMYINPLGMHYKKL